MVKLSFEIKDYIDLLLVASLIVYPFFFRLDFSKSNYDYFDIIHMVPINAWVFLLVLTLFFSILVVVKERVSYMHVMVATLLIYGLYVASQYPTIIQGDVLIHGRMTKEVISAGMTEVLSDYPRWWPGAFMCWACLSNIVGLDVISTNVILTFAIMIASSSFLYLLGKEILGEQWAGLPTILYLVTNAYVFHFMGRDHFSPQSLAFVLYLFVIYLLMRIQRTTEFKRSLSALTLILIVSILVSHGFTSLYIFFTLFGIAVVKRIRRIPLGVSLISLLFTWTSWFAWWLWNAGSTLETMLTYLVQPFTSATELKLAGIANPVLEEPLPLIGVILRNYYFKPLILIVGLVSLIVMFRDRKAKIVSIYSGILLGAIAASVLSMIISRMVEEVGQLSEILMFALLPTCYLAARFLARNPLRAKISSLVIILLITPSFLNMFTYSCEYISRVTPWEVNGYQFLASRVSKSLTPRVAPTIASDEITCSLYGFYDVAYVEKLKRGEGIIPLKERINWTSRREDHPIFFEGDVIVRSFRHELRYNIFLKTFEERRAFWLEVDLNLINDRNYNKIYDDGPMCVYTSKP